LLSLSSISIFQFKNYPQASFAFGDRIVGVYGRNGKGKTNLLDAIHYLCFTKSYFAKTDSQHVLQGARGFRLAGDFLLEGQPREVICILRETGKKEFLLDGESYDKLARHIGKFPCVFIAPDDVRIITEGSEERRRYLDTLISQVEPAYLQHLIDYNRVLLQRNSHLKSLAESRGADPSLLDVYDHQLAGHGQFVYSRRREFMVRLIPLIQGFYDQIAGKKEDIEVRYESALQKTAISDLLRQSRPRDLLLQRTTQGIHRDDLDLTLGGYAFKTMGSQGQRKSLLFAMKLAEFDLLRAAKGFPPILLLDDVFEKLDQGRMGNLLNWVCIQNKGQVFITDTHQERLENALSALGEPFQLLHLE
jgi:DNA replication and repair protein RecF